MFKDDGRKFVDGTGLLKHMHAHAHARTRTHMHEFSRDVQVEFPFSKRSYVEGWGTAKTTRPRHLIVGQ